MHNLKTIHFDKCSRNMCLQWYQYLCFVICCGAISDETATPLTFTTPVVSKLGFILQALEHTRWHLRSWLWAMSPFFFSFFFLHVKLIRKLLQPYRLLARHIELSDTIWSEKYEVSQFSPWLLAGLPCNASAYHCLCIFLDSISNLWIDPKCLLFTFIRFEALLNVYL